MGRIKYRNIFRIVIGKLYTSLHIPIKNYANVGIFSNISHRRILLSGADCIYIGNYVHIYSNYRIEAVKKYLEQKYKPKIIIGNHALINQNFHLTCADSIIIGDGTSITANCAIIDIIHPYENIGCNPRYQPINVKPVKIGANCLIAMNSVIMPGVTIGDHVIIGANSTVMSGDYPSFSVVAGSPAKIINIYNKELERWQKYQ